MKNSISLVLLFVTSALFSQDQFYKVSLLRAKPGELLELIDQVKNDIENYESYLEYKPYLLRHSQGDHWDLMIIYPIDDLEKYFSDEQVLVRSNSSTIEKSYGDEFYNIISFQEEAIVKGPSVNAFIDSFEEFNLFHIEIFTALAGKQDELLDQRLAENQFYAGIEHRPNFIFTRVFGPSWDNFTIGFYEDLHDFAGSEVPFEKEDQAAKEAGFEGVNYIGSYLRSLIADHHDTLAWKVND
ncbi:hypothetical protein [Ekhidna sp.]|uniref:hypothetical protein n=1 Tax=Ekhidna sp. TaxID=2608089 RepID=UPI003B50F770